MKLHRLLEEIMISEDKITESADGDAYFAGPMVQATLSDVEDPRSRSTLVYMSPEEFLKLALPGQNDVKHLGVAQIMKRGDKFSSLPQLYFDFDKKLGVAHIVGHEGRHRMHWLASHDVRKVPVEMRCRDELRWGMTQVRPFRVISQDGSSILPMPESVIFPVKQLTEIALMPRDSFPIAMIRNGIRQALKKRRKPFVMIDDIQISSTLAKNERKIYFIFAKDKIAYGYAMLERVSLSNIEGFQTTEIGFLDDLRFMGIGLRFYHLLLDRGYILISGRMQTSDGAKLWKKLISDPTVEVKYFDPKDGDLGSNPNEPWVDEDKILVAKKK